jgi:hypothetical protein
MRQPWEVALATVEGEVMPRSNKAGAASVFQASGRACGTPARAVELRHLAEPVSLVSGVEPEPGWTWKADGDEPPCIGCRWESHCGRYGTACTAWAQYAGMRRVRARRVPSGLLTEVEARSEARSEIRRRARQ